MTTLASAILSDPRPIVTGATAKRIADNRRRACIKPDLSGGTDAAKARQRA